MGTKEDLDIIAADTAEDEDEVEGEEEEEEEEEEEVEAAPPKRGKKAGVGAPAVSKPARVAPVVAKTKKRGMAAPPPIEDWPHEAGPLWEKIVGVAETQGKSASDMYITVTRTPLGPIPGEPVEMTPIDGAAVAGSEMTSPAAALSNYVIEVYHPLSPGPALFKCTFFWKRGNKIRAGEMRLPAPGELRAQRERMAARMPPPSYGTGVGMPPMPNYSSGQGIQPAMPGLHVGGSAQPQSSADPYTAQSVEGMRREMAQLFGRIDAVIHGNPPPPVAPVAAPAVGVGAPGDDLDTRIARTVVSVLQQTGMLDAVTRMNQATAAAQQQAAVGVGSPSVAALTRAKEGLSGLEELVGIFRQVEGVKRALGMGAPIAAAEEPEEEEEPAPAVVEAAATPPFGVRPIPFTEGFTGDKLNWVERGDEESMTDWLTKMAAANPKGALKVLEVGMRMLDQGAFGQLLMRLSGQGGPQAQAAAQIAQQLPTIGVSGVPTPETHQHVNGAGTGNPTA